MLAEKTEECTAETVLIAAKPGSPGNLIKSDINPNGDSELAVLMRVMRDDLRNARDHLLREDSPASLLATHSKIRCSWPTDPNVRDAKFDQMAVSYLLAIEDLTVKPQSSMKMAYGRALNHVLHAIKHMQAYLAMGTGLPNNQRRLCRTAYSDGPGRSFI